MQGLIKPHPIQFRVFNSLYCRAVKQNSQVIVKGINALDQTHKKPLVILLKERHTFF